MKKNQSKALIDIKIEDRLFQTLVAFLLTKIKGVCLPQVGLIDMLFAKSGLEKLKFIEVVRDDSAQTIDITITLQVEFGVEIPKKAGEIQKIVRDDVTKSTGYSVQSVYIIFQSLEEKSGKETKTIQLQLDQYKDR